MHTLLRATLAVILLAATPALAQLRQDVAFEITTTTAVGQSIFITGDLPELGSGNLANAPKLIPSGCAGSTCTWRLTLSLPRGRSYSFQYWRRGNAPGQSGYPSGGSSVSGPFNASTLPLPTPQPTGKTLFYHSAWNPPVLNWRHLGTTDPFTPITMTRFGPGRNATETRWVAQGFGSARRPVEFFLTPAIGTGRDPAQPVGNPPPIAPNYATSLDAAFLQAGQLFNYVPAPAVSAARRDYSTAALPSIASTNLNQTRFHRVWLPRGFNEHTARTYPVLYMHDGQNIFEAGPFGTWNADAAANTLINAGQMREVIIVGADNIGATRLADYSANENGFGARADAYLRYLRDELRPAILARYPGRINDDPALTGTVGSSMGGQVSLYAGWDFNTRFTRIGAFSGAFQISGSGVPSSVFYNRVQAQPIRPIRLYLDSGDSGTAQDNFGPILTLRDNLVNPARPAGPYTTANNFRYVVGINDQHNEPAWARRIPQCYTLLYPPEEDLNPLLAMVGPHLDTDADGTINLDDLFTQHAARLDLNFSGTPDPTDTQGLESNLRRDELTNMAAGR